MHAYLIKYAYKGTKTTKYTLKKKKTLMKYAKITTFKFQI